MDLYDYESAAFDRLQRSLIDPDGIFGNDQPSISRQRRVLQNKRFINEALNHEKHNIRHVLSVERESERKLVSLEKKRREFIMDGIKYRNKLEKLSDVQQMSTILLMQRQLKRRKEHEENLKKKQLYYKKRTLSEDRQEMTERFTEQRRIRLIQKNKEEEARLEMEKMRLDELAQQERRNRVEQRRIEQSRQRNRLRRFQAFKIARAIDNYNEKVLRIVQEQKKQQQIMRQLCSREGQHKQIMKRTERLGQSSMKVQRLLEGKNFQLTTL